MGIPKPRETAIFHENATNARFFRGKTAVRPDVGRKKQFKHILSSKPFYGESKDKQVIICLQTWNDHALHILFTFIQELQEKVGVVDLTYSPKQSVQHLPLNYYRTFNLLGALDIKGDGLCVLRTLYVLFRLKSAPGHVVNSNEYADLDSVRVFGIPTESSAIGIVEGVIHVQQ